MANTVIQILRSYVHDTPNTLHDGELAYSFTSNTLYIGNTTNGVIAIAGEGYIANVINPIDGGSF
jgi:hypothetical protein